MNNMKIVLLIILTLAISGCAWELKKTPHTFRATY